VSHQGDILASHCSTSCQKRFDATKIFLPTFRTGCYLRDIWENDQPLLLYYYTMVSIPSTDISYPIVFVNFFTHSLGEFDKSHLKTLKIITFHRISW
jgi:hypothetical protein